MSLYHPLSYEGTLNMAASKVKMWNISLIAITIMFCICCILHSWWCVMILIVGIILAGKSGNDRKYLEYVKNKRPVIVNLEVLRETANKRAVVAGDDSLTDLKKESLLGSLTYPTGSYVEVEGKVVEVSRDTLVVNNDQGTTEFPYVMLILKVVANVAPRYFTCAFGGYCGGDEGVRLGEALIDVAKETRLKVYGRIEEVAENDPIIIHLVECRWQKPEDEATCDEGRDEALRINRL